MLKRFLTAVMFAVLGVSRLSGQEIPKVHLIYPAGGTVFDQNCARITKTPANDAYIAETVRRRDEFQAAWDQLGPKLLQAVLSEIGVKFPYVEMQATLAVCGIGGNSGLSSPLMIYMEPWLREENRRPMWLFTETVFHELMHHYTRDVYSQSPIRDKYASESLVVRNHLHVMALVRLGLEKLGMTEEFKYQNDLYRGPTSSADYKRAWEIVNDIEGAEALLKELRAMSR